MWNTATSIDLLSNMNEFTAHDVEVNDANRLPVLAIFINGPVATASATVKLSQEANRPT